MRSIIENRRAASTVSGASGRSGLLNLERLSAFIAVAECGSFTAAADRFELSKSALSQSISALERELGVQLLQRSTRRLAVTEAGVAFLDDSRALLAQAGQIAARARTGAARPSGTLRLTSAADSATEVAGWIAQYRQRYPEMRIEYVPTDRTLDLIDGRFDLALRIGMMRDSRLRGVKLQQIELLLVAADSYLAAHGTPTTPRQLIEHEWLALSVLPAPWSLTLRARNGTSTRVKLSGSITVSSATAQRALAIAGAGIAAMPSNLVQADLDAGRLTRLLASYRLQTIYFYALYSGLMAPPPKTRAFIDLVKAQCAAQMSN